jgi:hypothetical protein
LKQLYLWKSKNNYFHIYYWVKHGPATRLKTDIIDNISNDLIGSRVKSCEKRIMNASLKTHLLVTEIGWTTAKTQINFFLLSPNLLYYSLCCFYPYLIYERNVIFYKLVYVDEWGVKNILIFLIYFNFYLIYYYL